MLKNLKGMYERQCYFLTRPKMALNYSSMFRRSVTEIYYYISMLFWIRHASFRRVENEIYDPSARILKHPLNFTIFWPRHLNSATR